uniref:LRAT domain-containing protein n=1 Tax=Monopterus albus TaxID=43700 RepID=A0A3Q3Q720_MONAL
MSNPSFSSSSASAAGKPSYDLSGPQLKGLFNQPVHQAERVARQSQASGSFGIDHSGVRVTVANGTRWLIHKGSGYGVSSQTVVVNADHMGPGWKPISPPKDFGGSKIVADFVHVGGTDYNLLFNNCHHASKAMMNQK